MRLQFALVTGEKRIVTVATELQILALFTAAGLQGDQAAETLNRLKALLTTKVRRIG